MPLFGSRRATLGISTPRALPPGRSPTNGDVVAVLVFTFPGQGSQRSGMGEPWVDHPSWEVVEEASAATNRDLSHLLLAAEMEELTQTANAQLATTVLSLVILD